MFAVMALVTCFLFAGWLMWCWAALDVYINPRPWETNLAPLWRVLAICFFSSFPFLLSLVITYQLW